MINRYRYLAKLYTSAWLLDVLLDQLLLFMRLLALGSDSRKLSSTLYHLWTTNSLVSGLNSRFVHLYPEILNGTSFNAASLDIYIHVNLTATNIWALLRDLDRTPTFTAINSRNGRVTLLKLLADLVPLDSIEMAKVRFRFGD